MTNKELAEQTRKALEAFDRLPPEEQVRRMIDLGTINEWGEVLMGQPERKHVDRPSKMKITVTVDEAGKFEALYVRVRTGRSVHVKEFIGYFVDYDAQGRLLGVEMLEATEIEVPDRIKMRRKQ